MQGFALPPIPGELHWHVSPTNWSHDPSSGLRILAGPETDWFSDPAGSYVKDNAPCALVSLTDECFLLAAKVSVEFGSVFDAGAIQVRVTDERWAKLCLEYSPQRRPTIVSVVTRGLSDDCNSAEVAQHGVYLRVARASRTFAFHYSVDGRLWHLVRYFSLGEQLTSVRVGFSAQSPTGAACAAVFSEIFYRQGALRDLRNGE